MATLATERARPIYDRQLRPVFEALAGLSVAAVTIALTAFRSDNSTTRVVALVIVVMGSLWFATTRRTALALGLLLLYLGLLDGYLKLATGSNYVTFVRDALLWSLAIGVLLRASLQHKRLTLPPLSGWVLAFVIVVFVELFNPDNGTLYHSFAGVRQHLEFVPLFFLAFACVRTKGTLRTFAILLVLVAVANGVVNYIQFRETPAELASWGPGYAERVLGLQQFGFSGRTFFTSAGQELTRPFGLGSDAGDGGLMAAFAIGAILALATLPGRRRYLLLAAVGAIAAVVAIITSQGRAVIVCGVVVAFTYALLTTTSRRGASTVVAIGAAALLTLFTVESVVGTSGPTQLRYGSFSIGNIVQTTASSRGFAFSDAAAYLVKYPLGAGLGVGGPATGSAGAPPQAGALDAENELTFAEIETGIAGLVCLVGFPLTLLIIGFRRCRLEPDPEVRILLAATIAPIAGMLVLYVVSAVTPTTPAGPYLWAAGGIISYWLVARPAELRAAAAGSRIAPSAAWRISHASATEAR
ncbi:MAG: hypothetical protein ACLP01_02275 [Solirubrobacteraceae bacterium]